MSKAKQIEQITKDLEKIGMIGSPSSTSELTLDILGSAVDKKLVGELAAFQFKQDGKDNFAIGQITEIELRNIWLEGAALRSIARQKGTVNPVSGQQDTHLGKMIVSAVFSKESDDSFEQSILGTVPATGSYIQVANDDFIQKILENQKNSLFYLGNVYGSKPLLPMQFRHFGNGEDGAGEAYHLGIFGKTGSGKSHLTKMILSAYMRFAEMGILILDPQSEFSKDFTNEEKFPLKTIAKTLNKKTATLTIKNLVLDRWELFEQILNLSLFFEQLTVPSGDNRDLACRILTEKLQKAKINLKNLHERTSFDTAWKILQDTKVQTVFYRSPVSRDRFHNTIANADADEFYNDYWKPVAELFNEGITKEDKKKRKKIEGALNWLLTTKGVLIIDLSKEQFAGNIFWNDKIQAMVIKRILQGLNFTAEAKYKEKEDAKGKKDKSLNLLVVIDEAHRLAKRDNSKDDTEKSVKEILVRSSRETRKYGLGWMFVSQTLASLDKEIINQLRINFFGFGLSMGTEYQNLRELAGGNSNALKLYQSFKDPHSSLNPKNRQYSFMTIGPSSPLSFAGTPLFFTAFNLIEYFMDKNALLK